MNSDVDTEIRQAITKKKEIKEKGSAQIFPLLFLDFLCIY